MELFCNICREKLTSEDIKNLKITEDCIHEGKIYGVLVCQKHYCECMPERIPTKWICKCATCDDYLCNSCGYYIENDVIVCYDCANIINNYKSVTNVF